MKKIRYSLLCFLALILTPGFLHSSSVSSTDEAIITYGTTGGRTQIASWTDQEDLSSDSEVTDNLSSSEESDWGESGADPSGEIDWEGSRATNLSGIKNPSYCTTLILAESKVKNFTGIEKFTRLYSLDLTKTLVKNFDFLSNLLNLRILCLSQTSFKDCKILERLSQLEVLDLVDTPPLKNPHVLSSLKKLQKLRVNSESFAHKALIPSNSSVRYLAVMGEIFQEITLQWFNLPGFPKLHTLMIEKGEFSQSLCRLIHGIYPSLTLTSNTAEFHQVQDFESSP